MPETTPDSRLEAHRRRVRELIEQSRRARESNPDGRQWGELPGKTWGNISETESR